MQPPDNVESASQRPVGKRRSRVTISAVAIEMGTGAVAPTRPQQQLPDGEDGAAADDDSGSPQLKKEHHKPSASSIVKAGSSHTHYLRHHHRPSVSAAAAGFQGGLGSGWTPAPQPTVSIDHLGSATVASAALTVVSWVYLTTMSFAGNATLAAFTFACFICSTLLFMAASARSSGEHSREHWGYAVPLGRRNFIWHRCVQAATLSFYLGMLSMVGVAAWNLCDSKRALAGVSAGVLGGVAVILGGSVHWYVVTHPLGVATDLAHGRRPSLSRGGHGGSLSMVSAATSAIAGSRRRLLLESGTYASDVSGITIGNHGPGDSFRGPTLRGRDGHDDAAAGTQLNHRGYFFNSISKAVKPQSIANQTTAATSKSSSRLTPPSEPTAAVDAVRHPHPHQQEHGITYAADSQVTAEPWTEASPVADHHHQASSAGLGAVAAPVSTGSTTAIDIAPSPVPAPAVTAPVSFAAPETTTAKPMTPTTHALSRVQSDVSPKQEIVALQMMTMQQQQTAVGQPGNDGASDVDNGLSTLATGAATAVAPSVGLNTHDHDHDDGQRWP